MAKRFIKKMVIDGFKKFTHLEVDFNESMNLFVGENEAGKSTVLDAIRLVLCQSYRNADKACLMDLFNQDQMKVFYAHPSVQSLPKIHIEVLLSLEDDGPYTQWFLGENHLELFGKGVSLYGIKFDCSFDEELGAEIVEQVLKGIFPLEYYRLSWQTFGEKQYLSQRRALGFLPIDVSASDSNETFNHFTRNLFQGNVPENIRLQSKNIFRANVRSLLDQLHLPELSEGKHFGVNDRKLILENLLAIFDGDLPLETRGSGMESIVKTRIALDKRQKEAVDVITIEEPENHLSYLNMRQMLARIEAERKDAQIIVATHSNMIVSRLGLKNVLWIDEKEQRVKNLGAIDGETAKFFEKIDNASLLDLLLSEKTILVEGATEFMLIPMLYKQITGRSVDEDGVSVISCGGISYKRYLQVAECRQRRVAVITDNDKDMIRISEALAYNQEHELTHVFMGNTIDHWTWEPSIYQCNKEFFDKNLKLQKNAKYLFHGEDYGRPIGYMLNNKAEVAYQMLAAKNDWAIPDYVKDAISWLGK